MGKLDIFLKPKIHKKTTVKETFKKFFKIYMFFKKNRPKKKDTNQREKSAASKNDKLNGEFFGQLTKTPTLKFPYVTSEQIKYLKK